MLAQNMKNTIHVSFNMKATTFTCESGKKLHVKFVLAAKLI
jgi:hypothetical protein